MTQPVTISLNELKDRLLAWYVSEDGSSLKPDQARVLYDCLAVMDRVSSSCPEVVVDNPGSRP